MKAYMCDECGKAIAARQEKQEVSAGFGFSMGEVTVELPPTGWFGASHVNGTKTNDSALLCSTDCLLRWSHKVTIRERAST